MFRRIKRFFADVAIELKKTTWPTKTDVIWTTVVTCIMVAVVTAFLAIVDIALSKALTFIFSATA